MEVPNQQEIEAKWQKKWEEEKVFVAKADNMKEKYFGTVAYPYANSVLHIGHGRTFTTAEIFLRYQRLLGKNILFPMGFHISGTPVLAVADGIKNGDKKQIKITTEAVSEYLDSPKEIEKTIKSFTEPANIARFFSATIEDSFKKVGIGIDWSRKFTTGEPMYNKFIEWQYKKLKDIGILSQGKYPILYSAQEQNAVGEDDITDGDIDKVTISEMTYILFESSKNKGEYFAVATLRPDALFGTTNLWIDPKMRIVKIKIEGQIWFVAKDSYPKFEHQFENVKIISEHKGSEFIGQKAITPILKREVLIAEASFLDSLHGTGIVYSSPAGAPHDYMALVQAKKEARLPAEVNVINTVDTFDKKGVKILYSESCPAEDKINKFGVKSIEDEDKLELAKQELYKEEHYGGKLNEKCAEFAGVFIKHAKDKVKAKLEEMKLGGTLLETSRRAKTRNGDNVIVANIDGQWFLDYSDEGNKQKAYDLLENMEYLPARFKETQMGYLKWVSKRPCARKRGLGTPLPFDKEWIIEPLSDSTIYQLFYHISGIITKEKIASEKLKEELFDYIYLNIGDSQKVANSTGIEKRVINEMKKEADYWNCNDFRYVGQPHMSNHMSFLIYHYALIFDKPELKKFHPKMGVVGGMLQRNGEKISKSKGNGIPLSKVGKEFGADLYRLYIAVAASFDVEMDFRDEELAQLAKKFERFKELMFEAKSRKAKKYEDYNDIDKWLISRFYSKVKIYMNYMGQLKIREAYVNILYEVLSDINYHSRRTSPESSLKVIRFFFKDFVKVMTPAVPHICEELYLNENGNEYVSLAELTTNPDEFINKKIEDIEAIVENLISTIARTKDNKELKELSKIVVVQASDEKFKLFDRLNILLRKTRDFKTIFNEVKDEFASEIKFVQKFVPKTLGEGLIAYLSKEKERKLIEQITPFIEQEFGAKVEISDATKLNINSQSIMPGVPGVILE